MNLPIHTPELAIHRREDTTRIISRLLRLPSIPRPLAELEAPSTSNQDSRDDVDQPDKQGRNADPLLGNGKLDGLDVEFDEDTRHHILGHRVRLLGDGVLVREDVLLAVPVRVYVEAVFAAGRRLLVLVDLAQRLGVGGVDGGDDGEVVLVLVEIAGGGREGVVQRVRQGWIEWAE